MNCLECQELLQRRLDGETVAAAELDQHLARCQTCRERFHFAQPMLDGIKVLPRPEAPADFAQRLAAGVLEDRRQRRRRLRIRLVFSAALAASVLLMVLAGFFLSIPHNGPGIPDKGIVKKDPRKDPGPEIEKAPELAKTVDGTRHAVASLTERLADHTKGQVKMLLSAAPPLDVPQMPPLPAVADPMDAAQSLRQASQNVADGFQPVARTARKAFDFFYRELAVLDHGE